MVRTIAIALLLLGSAAQAGQQSPETAEDRDGRCLAVFSLAASSEDKDTQEGGKIGAIFFAGKLRGRNPSVDFEKILRRAIPALEIKGGDDGERCGAELTAMGTAMTAAGAALQKSPN